MGGPGGGAAGRVGWEGVRDGRGGVNAGVDMAAVEAGRTKLFCGRRKGGSYAFEATLLGLGGAVLGAEEAAMGGRLFELFEDDWP